MLDKTLETIAFETRKSIKEGCKRYEAAENAINRIFYLAFNKVTKFAKYKKGIKSILCLDEI